MDEIVTFLSLNQTAHGPMHAVDGTEVPFTISGDVTAHVFQDPERPYVGRINL